MILQPTTSRSILLLATIFAAMFSGGCALNSGQSGCCPWSCCPRIDPTGQSVLVWPNEQAPALAPTTAVAATPSNVLAPPVLTDPFLPGGPPPGAVVGPAVAGGQQVAAAYPPGEALRLTPSRLLAPVGSEVIIVGGVCGENGYLIPNDRVEWMLDRAGTGQIVTVGGRDEWDLFRLPQNNPRKIDNYYAVGATSPYNECLDRGTPDPSDDVQIRRGDAWITISSPTEGTSYVTGYAPEVSNWSGRTARATIYWIDAQWAFPAPVTLAPGESHTLTTSITRQTDGAPIAGWIVRYKVVEGAAGLGYEGGATSEVATNNQGRASVEITPTDNRGGSTNIEIEITRPEQAGSASSPRVTLAKGVTSISWADGGISGTPMPVGPATVPPLQPTPTAPPTDDGWNTPIVPTTPSETPTPAEPQPTGTPDLKVTVQQTTTGPLRVGSTVDFLVKVKNQGNGTAKNVKVVDEFDVGLTSSLANAGTQTIRSERLFDLVPNEEAELPLTFTITQPGRLSHNVTVSADNAVGASERAFLTVDAAGSSAGGFGEPSLRVTMVGPERHTVGETAYFRVNIQNTGTVPATNLEITTEFDQELAPDTATEPIDLNHYNSTGQIRWKIARLDPGKTINQEVYCKCQAASASTCGRVEVVADGLTQPKFDQKCIQVRSQLGAGGLGTPPPGGATTPPPGTTSPPATAQGGLPVTINRTGTPRVGQRQLVYISVTNNTGQPQRNVKFRALVPAELQADVQQVQSQIPMQPNPWADGRVELIFGPVADLAAGATLTATIPVSPVRAGQAELHVESSSSTVAAQDYVDSFSVEGN